MRFLKQIGYGFVFLLILCAVGFGIYRIYFYEAPTCFDNIQNQKESDIDCGGSCISCELKNAKLQIDTVNILKAGESKSTLITLVDNPINYSATFEYKINVVGNFGVELYSTNGFSSVSARGSRYIVIPGVSFSKDDAKNANIEIVRADWNKEEGTDLRTIELRGVEATLVDGAFRVTGKLFNDSLDVVERARATAIIKDKSGNILSASAVDVGEVGVSREKTFTVFFPKLDFEAELEEIDTNVFGEVTVSL